jgi:cytidylate kinase
MAKEGGYVIVGRGAQFILKGHPNVLHVLLVADNRSRIEFLVGHHEISRSEAVKQIRTKQRERAAVASRLFKSCIDDLSLYHTVLNTGLMPYEWAVETVCQVVNRFIERESKLAV